MEDLETRVTELIRDGRRAMIRKMMAMNLERRLILALLQGEEDLADLLESVLWPDPGLQDSWPSAPKGPLAHQEGQ